MANTSSYILRYFDLPGLAETSRTLLNFVGAQWAEEHPEWPATKGKQPFGRLPVLVEKDASGNVIFELSESVAVERYILRTFGLLPTDAKAAARQEQLRDQFTDILLSIVYYDGAEDADKAKRKENAVALIKTAVSAYSKLLRENGSNGHFIGSNTTYVDIAFYNLVSFIRANSKENDDGFASLLSVENAPEFEKVIAAVEADSALQSHFATRQKMAIA
ncbi:hypothetical protein DL89DRAFT_266233 [Linderina pennispora]|uniref:Glutathione S-transferase n=1 Tax=Linderina pennispora TaxID=61395 RepID=A0A1Y1WDH1_9FUNG|nr:uncharacterized protein DL89DRAFT_266233 [Linderina pennispora]ORX71214.1 hypothetical protein DL89DRAFT_266233 [Linderina pennispora]